MNVKKERKGAMNGKNRIDSDLLERIKSVPRKDLSEASGIAYPYLSNLINEYNPCTPRTRARLESGLKVLEKKREKYYCEPRKK